MSLCSGALFGMGEDWEDRLDLAFELRDIEPDEVPLNFLIPIDGTPLAATQPLDPMESLHIISVYRFLLPSRQIKVAGGREANLAEHQHLIFRAGADSFLIGNYLTTCGQSPADDHRMLQNLEIELETGQSIIQAATPSRAACDPRHVR